MTPLALALKGTAVLLAGEAVVRGLRRAPAAWRHAVWTAAFAALVALPFASALGLSWRVAVLPAETVLRGSSIGVLPGPAADMTFWAVAVWALGAAVVSLRWAAAHAAARRLVRRSTPLVGDRWGRAERHARLAVGLRRPVRLLLSDRLDVPAAWGARPARRAVLLPTS
ncbi:MAG TPA: hypothetical protein VF576_11215, partial [Rubricoccaceae bacterium]